MKVEASISSDGGFPIVRADDTSWMRRGSCCSYPEDVWFDEGPRAIKKAKAICASCPVLRLCTEYAMATTQVLVDNRKVSYDEGIIAGMTSRERLVRLRSRGTP